MIELRSASTRCAGEPVRSFHLVDRSCYRRQEDVSLVRRFFLTNGWIEAPGVEDARCVVLLTCAEMRYKVVNMIREVGRLSKRISGSAELIVGGCLPKTDKEALAQVFQGKTLTPTDFSSLNSLPDIRIRVEDMPPAYGRGAASKPLARRAAFSRGNAIPYGPSRWLSRMVRRHIPIAGLRDLASRLARIRGTEIYVSAGCAKNCSYCAIHFATGQLRSKPLDLVVQNISDGLQLGYRTFNLQSDSIGGYGLDLGTNLGELLGRILKLPGYFTIGLDDLHPHEFIRYFEQIRSLCRARRLSYLYVPVQSGNERVLGMMRRQCDVKDLATKLTEIRRFGEVFLQTCMIVGFPGETESEFEDSLRFLKSVGFDRIFVHYYCDMPNTESSRLPGKTDKATMSARLERVNRSGIRHSIPETCHEWESNLVIS